MRYISSVSLQLLDVFQDLFEVLDVTVTGFSEGSIVTRFEVILPADSDVAEADVRAIFYEDVVMVDGVIINGVIANAALQDNDLYGKVS